MKFYETNEKHPVFELAPWEEYDNIVALEETRMGTAPAIGIGYEEKWLRKWRRALKKASEGVKLAREEAQLPPGWKKTMNFGKRTGYRGPDGQRVTSVPAAWREHERTTAAPPSQSSAQAAPSAQPAPSADLSRDEAAAAGGGGGSDDDSAPAAAENPSVEVEVNLLEAPRTGIGGAAEPSETSDDEEELEGIGDADAMQRQRAVAQANEQGFFSLSDDQKQALKDFEKGIPRLLDNMSLYSNTAVLEQAIADVCGEPQFESSVNKKLFEVILEKARTVLDLLEKKQSLSFNALEDMWELRSDPTLDDDDAGIRGFLLEEFAKDAANLETAVLYDRNVALHMGSEEAAAEAGPPPGLPPGPRQKNLFETTYRFTRVEEAMQLAMQLAPKLELVDLHKFADPWKSSNPAHERRCIEMCKLAHGSAYVDKMFEKLSAKEAKPGSDRLSDASVPPHGKKVPKGKGDTKLSKDTKQAVMSSVYAAKYAVDGIVKGDYANVFVVQRPPGHHLGDEGRALGANSQGFCFMNGAAIAAEYYLLKHPGARVTIIDCELPPPPSSPPLHA